MPSSFSFLVPSSPKRSMGVAITVAIALSGASFGCNKSRRAVELVAGKDNTCFRTENGRIYCWGDDAYTQTKNPSFAAKPGQRTTPKRVGGLEGARSISLAASHGCAAMQAGGVQCFLDADLEPTSISGADAKSVSAFGAGVCALATSGELKCFRSESRELPRAPVDVPKGLPAGDALTSGERHACVLEKDGTVSCFGDGQLGQLGPMAAPPPDAPAPPPGASVLRKIAGLKDVTALAAGRAHTCALLRSGRVSCWGMNELGQVGRPGEVTRERVEPNPAEVEGVDGATAISAGYYHTCAVLKGGTIKCWGSNFYGELGRPPSKMGQPKAEPVEGITSATQLACGEQHTCMLQGDGRIACWGRNHRGQLGNGTTTDSIRPVEVKLP